MERFLTSFAFLVVFTAQAAIAAEAPHVEDEPADVAERELACAAQEAQPAAQPTAVAKARRPRSDVDDLGGLDRGRSGGVGGRWRGLLAPWHPRVALAEGEPHAVARAQA